MTMRLFQNNTKGRYYQRHFNQRFGPHKSFTDHLTDFHADLYDRVHTLAPVRNGENWAFYTHGDDPVLQRLWAMEKGMSAETPLDAILLAQIEDHRTEVFYNLDLDNYAADFVRRLPGTVKAVIGWLAVNPTAELSGHHMVCNFPGMIDAWRRQGLSASYFTPAHVPEFEPIPDRERPIDVLFVGTYSQYHGNRARVLERIAGEGASWNVHYALARSRMTRLAETPLGWAGPLRKHRRTKAIRRIAHEPVYGRDYVSLLQDAKIVINGAIDLSQQDKGNMRCFEAMGTGAALVSDSGVYPDGMEDQRTLHLYKTPDEAFSLVRDLLDAPSLRSQLSDDALAMIRERYSAERQWERFVEIVAKA